jgi:hypothetical protein
MELAFESGYRQKALGQSQANKIIIIIYANSISDVIIFWTIIKAMGHTVE